MKAGLIATLLVGGLGIGGAIGYLAGQQSGKKMGVAGMASSKGGDGKLFFAADKVYTRPMLPKAWQTKLYNLQNENYQRESGLVKEYAARVALGSKKGMTDLEKLPEVDKLMDVKVTDAEIKAFYETQKARLPKDMKYADIKPRIEQYLASRKGAEVFDKEWHQLEDSEQVKILVQKPLAPIVNIPVANFPSKGDATAQNVLVEVSDYLCPHCQQMNPQMEKAYNELKGKVKFVQINFSLRPDNLSGSLAKGGFCAAQQSNDVFWKYHKVAFDGSWGRMSDPASVDKVLEISKKVGADEAKMKTCMASEAATKFVTSTSKLMDDIGVTGTPAFFLNNEKISVGHDLVGALKAKI